MLLVALVLTLALTMSVCSALAGSITVTPPDNTTADSENTYTLYKVFDAVTNGTNYSYKLTANHATAPTGFILDDAGNVYFAEEVAEGTEGAYTITVGGAAKIIKNKTELSTTDIATIEAYVVAADKVDEKTVTGTAAAAFTGLADGYYYVKSTTGSLVVIDSTQPDVNIKDKNTVPVLDKKITGASSVDEDGKKALAQVGTTVNYSATITVGKGAINYVYHDKMETGLTYNSDAAVTNTGAVYTVGKVGEDTFTVTIDNDWIKTLEVGTVLTITYSATVNEDAITTDPLSNTAYVSYGDEGSDNHTPDSEADVYEAKFSVIKHDGAGEALQGAGFVIKNSAGKYYKLVETTTGEGEDAVTTTSISWVDSINDADVHTSDEDGNVPAFTGLANGTYTLEEKVVPTGYNKAANQQFTIAEHNYTAANLEQSATVVNNQGQELPSTGGIGTTLFYVAGIVLVLGAAAVIIARRKAEQE